MGNDKKDNLIVFTGGQTDSDTEPARLSVEGDTFDLQSFIISGETPEGKRIIFTWNASVDEMLSFNYVLNICVEDKVRGMLHQS